MAEKPLLETWEIVGLAIATLSVIGGAAFMYWFTTSW
jgi:hypothetical protein